MEEQAGSEMSRSATPPAAKARPRPAPARERAEIQRARLAVTRNTVLAAIVALGCVLLVLLVFNRPLVYRIFPWVEPDVVVEELSPPAVGEGIYWTETAQGHQLLVADPTLRPDLYLTIEFTWACGCQGSFVPAEEGQFAMYYPEQEKVNREKALCSKCRQALDYLEKKEQAEREAAGR